MYTYRKLDLDGKLRVHNLHDKIVDQSSFPDPYLYFQNNIFKWVTHKDDQTGVIDWEWIKSKEELE